MKKTFVFSIILLNLQIVFSQTITNLPAVRKDSSNIKEVRAGGFRLINPLLDCYEIKSTSIKQTKLIETLVSSYIQNVTNQKKAKLVSVYFRDLNNGPWIGINENENYVPASLLKVPLLISSLYQQERDPQFLSRVVMDTAVEDFAQEVTDSIHIIHGRNYTIEELLEYMIMHSDNEAKNLIIKNLDQAMLMEIFNELGVDLQKHTGAEDNFMSVKEYSSFFRVLYNASFLSRQMSEAALTMLSSTTFNDGIVAGVPAGIPVAHKFGARTFAHVALKQLHDCGIVYKPGTPYLLCIMTRGTDNKELQKIISDISRIIYTSLEANPIQN